jgi:ABC-type antimicrobial peptide transport system permease subunit
MAIASLKSTKMRSFLTMLGIIIGVVSVVTVVSIGEGIKHQVATQINQLGKDLITIRPGQLVQRGENGAVEGVNLLFNATDGGSLSNKDLTTVSETTGVGQAVPLSLVHGPITVNSKQYTPLVLATTEGMSQMLNDPVEFGEFFKSDTDTLASQPNSAVIGHNLATKLFKQRVAVGESFDFLGQTFFVRGVLKQFDTTPLSLTTDFNDTIFIPYQTAQKLTGQNTALYEILAKPSDPERLDQVAAGITEHLKDSSQGQQRFTVLRQDESLAVTNNILDLLTKMIAGIAAISLLVGGIGIMDVMLVSVAERMHEIGIRKALGASNRQILLQFLTEASVLSLVGGLVGILLSLIINFVLRVSTSLTPVLTWQVVVAATAVSLLVGIIFGTAPALKAARKDPIDALRNQ